MNVNDWVSVFGQSLVAMMLAGAGVHIAYAVGDRVARQAPLSVKWSVIVLAFFYLATLAFHLLASLGVFRLWAVAVLAVVSVGACHVGLMRISEWARRMGDDVHAMLTAFARAAPAVRVAGGVAALLIVITFSKTLLVPPLGWDAVSYHMPKAAMWVQYGRMRTLTGPGGWSYFPLFPGGGDLVYAWAMLPFRSDLLACAAGGGIWIITGMATYGLARAMGVSRWGAGAATVLMMFTPAVHRITGSGYVEPVLQLFTVLTAICATMFLERRQPAWLASAVAGAGLMSGVKVMGLVLGATAVLSLFLVVIVCHRKQREHWTALAIGVLLALLAVAPWWWRAIMETGRPLSPIPIRVLGLELGRINPDLQWLQVRPSAAFSWEREWQTLKALFVWTPKTPSLGGVWAIFLVLLPVAAIRIARLTRRSAWLSAVLILTFLAAYHHPDMLVLRTYWPTSNARYWIQIVPLAAVLLSSGAETFRRGRLLWVVSVLAVTCLHAQRELFWGVSGVTLAALPWVSAGLCAAAGLSVLLAKRRWWAELFIIGVVAIPLAAVRLSEYRDATRWEVYRDEGTKSYHDLLRYWVNAAEALDEPGTFHRIAVTSAPWQNGDNWLVYPLLGRRFQNELVYVPISKSGEVVPFDGTMRYLESADPAAWIARLYQQGVSHVMSFWPPSIEGYWMLRHPAFFEPISVSRKWGGCFRLRSWPDAQRRLENQEDAE